MSTDSTKLIGIAALIIALTRIFPGSVEAADKHPGDRKGHNMLPRPREIVVPPAPVLKPAESMAGYQLKNGFIMEAVAVEPMIEDPVAMTFDGDGRMWVVEMRGFMPNALGEGEDARVGRISILEDTDWDGVADKHTVFLDGLVLPRAVCLVEGGILWADQDHLYFVEDLDGRPGRQKVVSNDFLRGGNVEHKPNGFISGLDNWIYLAKSKKRLRWRNGQLEIGETFYRGQWGISQDDHGRLLANNNSSSMSMDLVLPNFLKRNPRYEPVRKMLQGKKSVFPIRVNTGVNRGYMVHKGKLLTKKGYLKHFTAACGPCVYRGDQFPQEYQGNVFTPEPAAHLIKRMVLNEKQGEWTSTFAYPDSEFVAGTDERSRFVNLYNAPDGSLYVVDMYRGILQHRTYMTTYLHREIKERKLDEPTGLGRIYRIRYKDNPLGEKPQMRNAGSAKLVEYLSHANGWWRDTAQRLLVQRGDSASIPVLEKVVGDPANTALGKIHTLWTLDGLEALDLDVLKTSWEDKDPMVVAHGIRLSERLIGKGQDEEVLKKLKVVSDNDHYQVQLYLAGVLGRLQTDGALVWLERILRRYHDTTIVDSAYSGLKQRESELARRFAADATLHPVLERFCAVKLDQDIIDWIDGIQSTEVFAGFAGKALEMRNKMLISQILKTVKGFDRSDQLTVIRTMVGAAGKQYRPMDVDITEMKEHVIDVTGDDLKLQNAFLALFKSRKSSIRKRSPEIEKQLAEGRQHYQTLCGACHQADGSGVKNMTPPLKNSEWVMGSPVRLAAMTLAGVQGPIHVAGKQYQAPEIMEMMPGLKDNPQATNHHLAALLTYIRNSWGHTASEVTEEDVKKARSLVSKHPSPYSKSELEKSELWKHEKNDHAWVKLFNGSDLTNWENPYEWGEAEVVDGEIQLTTIKKKFFLLTKKRYRDFAFEVEVKMPEGKSNSGFLFRCHKKKNRAWGYQAEVDPSDRKWSGGFYDEGRRNWIHPKKGAEGKEYNAVHWTEERKNAFKRHDWNHYRIECRGEQIRIWVNGVLTTDLQDDLDREGYIGLQHHGEKGKVYRFRNIRIQEFN